MSALPHNMKLLERARQLRRDMTKQESRLWYDFFKNFPLKVYRQRIIGSYIADFYCHELRLVIEVDGAQHEEADNVLYDEERTAYLNSLGLTVLRFSNSEVDKNFNEVCRKIEEFAKEAFSF